MTIGQVEVSMQNLDYPNITEMVPLEYEWEGYELVTAFYTPDSLFTIEDYFADRYGSENQLPEDGKLEFHFDGGTNVLFVDVAMESAVDDLHIYLGSATVRRLADKGLGTVGVFLKKSPGKW